MRFSARWLKRPSLRAIALIGLIVVGQFVLLEHLVQAQRNSAHVIDISGAQRMRSQRIAFLVERIHDRGAAPQPLRELRESVSEMRSVRSDLLSLAAQNGGLSNFDGRYALGGRVRDYLADATAFLANPRDERAYGDLMGRRVDLLEHLDLAVKGRAAESRSVHDQLAIAFAVSLMLTLVTLIVGWMRIVLPNEVALEKTLKKVIEAADHQISLLEENPNLVAFLDRSGVIVHGNLASLRLLGRTESLIGRDFTEMVARRALRETQDAFRCALQGTPVTYETVLVDARGGEVDVEVTSFPNVVNGSIVGVITLAKDIREIKVMEQQMREHTERISELYRIAATHGRTYDQQVEETLALVAARLGYQWAAVSEVSDNTVTPIAIVGRVSGIARDKRVPLERTLSRHALSADTVWSVGDLQRSEYAAEIVPEYSNFMSVTGKPVHVDHHAAKWGSIAIAPVRTGDRLFGTLTIGSDSPRHTDLSTDDAEFLRAVSGLLGLVIERNRQERRLDRLAFLDSLTGLPNRVSLMDRLGAIGESSKRHAREYAVLYLDLDRFKQINDVFGHATGDEVLRLAARRMQGCVRPEDTVARLGGDEFVILVPTPYGRSGAEDLAERILAAIKKPFVIDGVAHLLGVSIGIALHPMVGGDANDLLKAADEALYRAKRAGRNQMAFAA